MLLTAIALGCASPATVPEPGTDALELGELLASDDAGVRAGVATAGTIGPAAIVRSRRSSRAVRRRLARCAELALWCIAHHSCRADAGDDRDAASAACLQLLAQQPPRVRPAGAGGDARCARRSTVERRAARGSCGAAEIGEAVVRALERIRIRLQELLAAIARDRSAPHRARAVAALAGEVGRGGKRCCWRWPRRAMPSSRASPAMDSHASASRALASCSRALRTAASGYR
ncbi:MAG: hypothetical protein U1E76_16620 [Planctomycetota bacterium]